MSSGLELALRLVGGVLLTGMNAFFVVAEFALTRLPQMDPAEDGPGLERARTMTNRLEIYLTGCQLGITTSSILLGVVAEPAFTHLLRPLFTLFGLSAVLTEGLSVVVAVVLINLIHKIWGEQTPTYLGVERPRQVARYTARPLDWWVTVAYPFIMAGDGIAKSTLGAFGVEVRRSWTEAEAADDESSLDGIGDVRRKMGEVLSRANLSRERQAEVLRTLDIDHLPVSDIMVPRAEVTAVRLADDLSDTLGLMRERVHDRYPLLGDDWTDVRGTLYLQTVFQRLPDLQSGTVTLQALAEPPVWVPADLPVSALIDRLQEEQQEVALVRDGPVAGLVTLTDAFEAIAGEMEDPVDAADTTYA
jgi:CBS domain containing-hemolysin-like protein